MIIFDSSYLIVHLHPNPETPKDRAENPVTRFRERVDHLIATLNGTDQVIGVPTPALAEILVRAGKGKFRYLQTLNDAYRFEILPFDKLAAIDAGELIEKIKVEHKSQPVETWAKAKFDIQIVAIGKAVGATKIYSDDKQIEAHGKRLKIDVVRICDLPLPPESKPEAEPNIEAVAVGAQQSLNLGPPAGNQLTIVEEDKPNEQTAPTSSEDGKSQGAAAHSTSIQGSDSGRAQGETAGEGEKET